MEIISSDSKFIQPRSYFKSKNNIVSINLNKSNNGCLYSLKSKDLVRIELL